MVLGLKREQKARVGVNRCINLKQKSLEEGVVGNADWIASHAIKNLLWFEKTVCGPSKLIGIPSERIDGELICGIDW